MSRRRSVINKFVLAPMVVLIFMLLVIVMAISFGRAKTSASAENLLSAMLLASFATSLAGSLSTSLQALFMSHEIRFLITLPIPLKVAFVSKFGDIARGAIPGALFGMAVSLGYVLGRAEQSSFMLVALLAVSILSVTAVAFAAGLTALIVRFAPTRFVRGLLLMLSLGVLIATVLTWQQVNPGTESISASRLEFHSLLPSGWAYELLVRSIGDDPASAIPYLTLLIGFLLLVTGIGASLFCSTFAGNLERTDLRQGNPYPRRAPQFARRVLRLVPIQVLHWVKREWILVGRDFARLSAAVMPIASVSIWVGSSLFWSHRVTERGADDFWLTHGPLLLLPWGISLGTTVFAFGSEGERFALIRSLPVKPSALMIGKFIAYALPITGFCLTAGLASLVIQSGSTRDGYVFIGLLLVLSASYCASDLAFSAASPRFDADNVQRSTGFIARLIATFAGLLAGSLIALGVTLSPVGGENLHAVLLGDSSRPGTGLWLSLIGVGLSLPVLLFATGTRRLAALIAHD